MPPTRETPRIIAGRYTIERVLGRGATANVYLARDAQTGDQVAVKVLLPEIAHGIGIARFLREIRLTSPFNHPNIVRIRDSGIAEDDLPFFVMPYMEGGSLRERLARDSQLPLSEAARITQDVAEALAHAHSLGLIHRDVKPENILFSGGRAMVSDFGIARAIAGSENISGTTPGVIRGTPAYMSPEQASGEADLDGRSDVYSLACVAYEMIAGLPPFVGPNARNVMAQRMTRDALAIQTYRSSAPAAISDVMKRAMAVDPADREADPREFARQLGEGLAAPSATHTANNTTASQPPTARSRMWIGGVAAVIGVAALASTPAVRRSLVEASLDSLRIAVGSVSAIDREAAGSQLDDAARAVAAEASSWNDVRTTTLNRPAERDPTKARSTLIGEAKRSRSQWLVELQSQTISDHLMLDAALVDASTGREVRRARANVGLDSVAAPGIYSGLVATLFGGESSDSPGGNPPVSLSGWRGYVRGRSEMQRWRLDSAERSFKTALQLSPSMDAASLRLGQIAVWHRQALTAATRTAIIRMLQRSRSLAPRDTLIARGVLAMDHNDLTAACAQYEAMRRLDSLDVVASLGLGDCMTRDHVVVPDSRSPSGLRFRASYQAGIDAYLRAARVDPASSSLFCPLNRVGALITSPNRIVLGAAMPPDTSRFAAYPALDVRADTVVLVPYPLGDLQATSVKQLQNRRGGAVGLLVGKHRGLLIALASSWVHATPDDPDAHEALAAALELRGDIAAGPEEATSAVAALEAAGRLTNNEHQRLRLAGAAARLDIKAGRFEMARARADSVLDGAIHRTAPQELEEADADLLAGLAALVGRPLDLQRWLIFATDKAATLNPGPSQVPSEVRREIAALTSTIVLGLCSNLSLALNRTDSAFRSFVPPSEYEAMWAANMPRLLSYATPCDRGKAVLRVKAPGDRLIRMQQAFARHQFDAVRAAIDTLDAYRGFERPGDVTLDYTFQESWLLAQIGDTARAVVRLQRTIDAFPTLGHDFLDHADQSAAICEVLDLASRLKARQSGPEAARPVVLKRDELCGKRG